MIIPRSFYQRDTLEVARALLGQILVHETPQGVTAGIIVETEAYLGKIDDASHSYKASRKRVQVQYEGKGLAYIYMIYGIHYCMNLTSGKDEAPEAILIRALEPVRGIELMRERRRRRELTQLCSGPGKLARAMDINMSQYGQDLTSPGGLYLEYGDVPEKIYASKRIGVEYAKMCADEPWRFTIAGSKFLSVPADEEKLKRICEI